MNPFRSWSLAQRYGISVASVALTTLALIQLLSLHHANIALLYLLVVLISATTIGPGPAMLASLLAFLGFNFFFVAPLHTFTAADSQDSVTNLLDDLVDWGSTAGLSTRIFEKFVRVAGPERHADGRGLGLAICKGIIELHRDRIWAEKLPTGGARFIFTRPLHAPANGAAARTAMRQMQADGV